jgi:hypothetical protein
MCAAITVKSAAAAQYRQSKMSGDVLNEIARCPHCGVAAPALQKVWGHQITIPNDGNRYWATYRCTSCGAVVLGKAHINQDVNNATLQELFPAPKKAHEDIPEPGRTFLQLGGGQRLVSFHLQYRDVVLVRPEKLCPGTRTAATARLTGSPKTDTRADTRGPVGVEKMATPGGFEPPTLRLGNCRYSVGDPPRASCPRSRGHAPKNSVATRWRPGGITGRVAPTATPKKMIGFNA